MATNNLVNNVYFRLDGNDDFSGTIAFNPTTAGLTGTTAADNASSLIVGQTISSTILYASRVTFTTSNTPQNLTSISLTAGLWETWGVVTFVPAGTTTISALSAGITTTSATLPSGEFLAGINVSMPAGALQTVIVPTAANSITGIGTTVYLVANVTFAVSTMQMCGYLFARRRYSEN